MAVFSGNGTNAAPSFTFSSDTNTGMYRYDSDKLALTTAGVARLIVQDNGNIAVAKATASDMMDITGGYRSTGATSNANVTGALLDWNPTEARLFSYSATGGDISFFTTPSGGTVTRRGTFTSDGYFRMASGTGGIQFGGDTAAANALDDYEEGTWTPELTVDNSLAGITYNSRTGEYTKIGNVVYVSGELDVASYSLPNTGQLEIASLPFTSGSPTGKNYQFFQLTISGIDLSQGGFPNLSPLNVVWGRLITSDLTTPTTSSIGVYISADSGSTDITPRSFRGAYLTGHTPIIQFSGWYTI